MTKIDMPKCPLCGSELEAVTQTHYYSEGENQYFECPIYHSKEDWKKLKPTRDHQGF